MYWATVVFLGGIAAVTVLGSIGLAIIGKQLPDGVVGLGIGAVTALASLLAPTRS
jgi:hypothetical protein